MHFFFRFKEIAEPSQWTSQGVKSRWQHFVPWQCPTWTIKTKRHWIRSECKNFHRENTNRKLLVVRSTPRYWLKARQLRRRERVVEYIRVSTKLAKSKQQPNNRGDTPQLKSNVEDWLRRRWRKWS